MARKRFVRDMDFETEASEPDDKIVTKGNRNERGPNELRSGDWLTNRYENWDKASLKKKNLAYSRWLFHNVVYFFTLFVCCPSLHTQTNKAPRGTIFRSAIVRQDA